MFEQTVAEQKMDRLNDELKKSKLKVDKQDILLRDAAKALYAMSEYWNEERFMDAQNVADNIDSFIGDLNETER